MCKAGAGQESTSGEADTPGYPLTDEPVIQKDHRKTTRLYMPRNNTKINQSSMDLLQSWRGNCDVQLLIYNSNPKDPNISEIAKVTDYVVAYSCKGHSTHMEEVEQNKKLILRADELTKDKTDVTRICKQVMNEACKKRMISKQESMVLLGDLDLTLCTETIENVSISRSKRLRKTEERETNTSHVTKYTNRSALYENMNMAEYYNITNNTDPNAKLMIPNFVGVNGSAVFPVTENYARHVLIAYRPWREYPANLEWKAEFEQFINSPTCPLAAQLPYRRVMLRHIEKMTHYQPKNATPDHSKNPIDPEDEEFMTLCGLKTSDDVDHDTAVLQSIDRGLDYKWDFPAMVSLFMITTIRSHPRFL